MSRSYFCEIFYDAVPLISLPKTSTWNKIALLASHLLKFPELVLNKVKKSIFKNIYQYTKLSLLNVNISGAYVIKELYNFKKIFISIRFLLIMNYHSWNSGVEESWNENLWKSLKVEISLKIQIIFLSVFKLCIVQKSEHVKLCL